MEAEVIDTESTALVRREPRQDALMPAINIQQAVDRYKAMTQFVKEIMRPDCDFGVIPGTAKPTLLKPGAEKLCTFFGLRTEFILADSVKDWAGGLFYFEYKCRLWRGDYIVGEGIGSANSKEKKYRYRNADRLCPKCNQPTILKSKQDDGWYCWAKKGGCGATFPASASEIINQKAGQVENTEPFELVNVLQKMAQKRAMIAATLVAVNASEFFTQDAEDFAPEDTHAAPAPQAHHDPAPRAAEPRQSAPAASQAPKAAATKAAPKPPVSWADAQIGNIEKVSEKTGVSKTGKPWTIFNILFDDGLLTSTFDAKMAETADEAIEKGLAVEYKVKPNGKYYDLTAIRLVDAAGPDNPANYPSEAEMAAVNASQDDLPY